MYIEVLYKKNDVNFFTRLQSVTTELWLLGFSVILSRFSKNLASSA